MWLREDTRQQGMPFVNGRFLLAPALDTLVKYRIRTGTVQVQYRYSAQTLLT